MMRFRLEDDENGNERVSSPSSYGKSVEILPKTTLKTA
jgi:hypothetical protein